MEITIKQIDKNIPYDLLLLADPSKELINSYLKKGNCFVAESDNKIIAVYLLININSEVIEIINIAVKEDFQGQGIGKKMILQIIRQARIDGIKTIEIGTGNSSLNQLALYQKCGFRISSIDHDFFVKNYDEEIIENGIICRDMIRLKMDLV